MLNKQIITYNNIFVIKHDTQVRWSKLYEEKITQADIDELCVRKHCGGTSHKEAFQKVLDFEQSYNTFVSLVLSLTDMCSDLSEAQKILPTRIPRIYLRTNNDSDISDLMGKVISVQ